MNSTLTISKLSDIDSIRAQVISIAEQYNKNSAETTSDDTLTAMIVVATLHWLEVVISDEKKPAGWMKLYDMSPERSAQFEWKGDGKYSGFHRPRALGHRIMARLLRGKSFTFTFTQPLETLQLAAAF